MQEGDRSRSGWQFAFDAGANAAGTVVAVAILYLVGVAVDVIPGDKALVLLSILVGAAGVVVSWLGSRRLFVAQNELIQFAEAALRMQREREREIQEMEKREAAQDDDDPREDDPREHDPREDDPREDDGGRSR